MRVRGGSPHWIHCNFRSLGLPVTGDGAGPPGDIPGREGTFPKKLGDIPASSISPTPRRGYPRPPGTSPGRVGDIPGRSGISPAASGMSPASGDIPGLWRGASPTGSGISPALRGMSRPRWCGAHTTHMCHMSVPLRRSKPTQQHVKRCLCNTTRPSEGSWCAAVAAAGAAFVPGGEARTSEPHREARRGEARGGQSRPQTTVCRCGAPSSTEQRSRRDPDSASSEGYAGGRRAAEPAAREGAWPRRAQGGSRGQALWSLGGASPRAHTQAVVSRRRSPLTTRMSGPEESPRDPDPPLGVERRWSLGGQHEHLPGADRASRRHVG